MFKPTLIAACLVGVTLAAQPVLARAVYGGREATTAGHHRGNRRRAGDG